MRLRHLPTAVIAALLLATPLVAPAQAAPDRDRPPRTAGQTADPRGDASGRRADRPWADVTRVRYGMPLVRDGRTLDIAVDLRRVDLGPFPDEDDPRPPEPERDQRIKTVVDGPGSLTWIVSFSNAFEAPRVIRVFPSGERREAPWRSATLLAVGGSGGGQLALSISTEWLRGDRAFFRTRAVSGRADDYAPRVGRLNTRYAGPVRRGASPRPVTAPTCTSVDGGTSCEWRR